MRSRRRSSEKNLPAEPLEAETKTRLFTSDGGQGRPTCAVQATAKRTKAVSGDHWGEMTNHYPKSARLLSKKDFTFQQFQVRDLGAFRLVINPKGRGRLGISIPKRIIKLSPGRNRIKRLWREAFRGERQKLGGIDLHVIGRSSLGLKWKEMKLLDIQQVISGLV